jgi:arylsulfatase A-like enzyme
MNLSRSLLTLSGFVFISFAGALGQICAADERPNIVFFFIDDLGWTDLGCMGSKYYETPHIDALSRRSTVFTNAYANGPNCAPSRACLMSGQYTPRHGIYTVGDPARGNHAFRKLEPVANETILADDFVTMAEALKSAGYTTATMGKWHLGKDPTTQGFDVNIAGREWGSPSGGGYHSPYRYPNLENDQPGEYLTDRLGQEACRFIEEHYQKPFFLYLTHYAVHTPIQGKVDLVAKYRSKAPGEHHKNPAYAAMIESVDDCIATVLAKLEDLQLSDKTIVIFFSDNGGHAGATSNHPLRGAKGMLYEGGIREPMIVHWPGVTQPGTLCHEPVIGIDFYPTLLEMTRTTAPPGYQLDGLSLVPLLKDPHSKLSRTAIFWHFPCYLQGSGGRDAERPFRTTPAGAIRMGDWKLIEYFEDGGFELFNLREDLGETQNLAEQHPEIREELHNELVNWRKRVDAPVPTTPNPKYDPAAKKKKRKKDSPH